MSSNNDFGIKFDLPKNKSNVIKVIGVGGGGSNAINHMFRQGIRGVDFFICNTDAQALNSSGVPNKIQLGVHLTEGLGAGANPEVGEQAAVESIEEIRLMLDTNTKMIFITAGMGGGTGTGAAPIIAKMAKEMGVLTVGIVTMPFEFEGKIRNTQAKIGVEKFRKEVDSLVIINNNKLREVYGNLGFKAGFSKADEVLSTAARGIAEVITHHYTQNIDMRDAKTVLTNSGTAIMGSAKAVGQNRAQEAIMRALDSPLLDDNKITGAKNVLLLIVSGTQEITIDEIGEINDHIQAEAGHGANIIMGVGEDEALNEAIAVTIIATGFTADQQVEINNTEAKKVVHALEDEQLMQHELTLQDELPFRPTNDLETAKKVVHQLQENLEEDINDSDPLVDNNELIPTTDLLRGLDVVYQKVEPASCVSAEEEEFIINEVHVDEAEPELDSPHEQDQTMLSFDMPIAATQTESSADEKTIIPLIEDVKEIEVNDYIELIPVTELAEEGETRYTLDDHIVLEKTDRAHVPTFVEKPMVETAEPTISQKEPEVKLVKEKPKKQDQSDTGSDPFNNPIAKTLRERADTRRQKMKEFNYKFNSAKIDEIEKEPAYKRQGVNLEETPHSSDPTASRISVASDDNDDIQLRKNNSFLHDNVD